MFDFFSELSDFFSQVVHNFNGVHDFINNSIGLFADALAWVSAFSSQLPPQFQWIAPLIITYLIFEFIRGGR